MLLSDQHSFILRCSDAKSAATSIQGLQVR